MDEGNIRKYEEALVSWVEKRKKHKISLFLQGSNFPKG